MTNHVCCYCAKEKGGLADVPETDLNCSWPCSPHSNGFDPLLQLARELGL